MRAFLTVAIREVRERRNVLLAALAASILPLLAPLLPGLGHGNVAEARTLSALILSGTLGVGVAILCGGALFSTDLAERRLGFYFSRPLPSAAIWGGKVAGGLLLVLASAVVSVVPAAILGGGLQTTGWAGGPGTVVLAILGVSAVLFLAANVVSVAIRARSPWLAIDLVLTPLLAAALWFPTRRLLRFGVLPEPGFVLGAVFGFLPLALLLASAAQVWVGRTDARRGHGAQSVVLWAMLITGALGYDLWSRWYVSPAPASLDWVRGSAVGSSGWALVEGSSPGRRGLTSAFLVDLGSGGTVRLPAASTWLLRMDADGTRAVLVEWDGIPGKSGISLVTLTLGNGAVSSRQEIPLRELPGSLFVSADGSRAGLVTGTTLQVLELPSGKILASSRLPAADDWAWEGSFVRPDLVRLWPRRPAWKPKLPVWAPPPIVELDVAARKQAETGRYGVPPVLTGFAVTPSPDGTALLARALPQVPEIFVLDSRTGEVRLRLSARAGAERLDAAFLADGQLVTSERLEEGLVVSLRSTAGETLRTIELPGARKTLLLGPEVKAGVIAVAVAEFPEKGGATAWDKGRLLLLDVGTGNVTEGPAGFRPAFSTGWWYFRPGEGPAPAGTPVSRLVSSGDRRLSLLDPGTMKTTPLFGR